MPDEGGINALRAMPTRGCQARLNGEEVQALGRALPDEPTEHGFGAGLWTFALKAPRAHLKQPLQIIWDGPKAHRGKLVREYLDSTDGDIQMAFLPPCSRDLDPAEYLWAWLKRHTMADLCPATLHELNATARAKRKSIRRRPSIIAAC